MIIKTCNFEPLWTILCTLFRSTTRFPNSSSFLTQKREKQNHEIFKIKKKKRKSVNPVPTSKYYHDRETDWASFSILSTSSGESFLTGFLSFSGRKSNPKASDTSSELHPAFRSESENLSALSNRASSSACLSNTTISPSKNPEAETWTISDISGSLHPPALKTDPICSTYSSTQPGTPDRGISKNLSGEDDADDEEFLRRRSVAASVQNSTHLGVLPPASRLLREKAAAEEDEPADFSLTDRCFLRSWALESELRKSDSRWKKSERSKPQQKILFSST